MKLSLIGMSGVGKTYWAKQLESLGFKRFSCDDVIEKKLEKELRALGYSGINDVAKWMGQPYDQQYEQNSQTYLRFEKESMQELYAMIENTSEKIVIDTTGSIIYTGDYILELLGKHTKIIFLETPEAVIQEMYDTYMIDPKPVVWGDAFTKRTDETNKEALQRCYPEFLQFRVKEYEKLAHTRIDYYELRKCETGEDFIKLII